MPHEIIYAYVKISRQRFELIDVRLAVAVLPMRDRHFGQAQQFGNVRLRELVFRAQFFEPVFEFHTFSVTKPVTIYLTVTNIVTIIKTAASLLTPVKFFIKINKNLDGGREPWYNKNAKIFLHNIIRRES